MLNRDEKNIVTIGKKTFDVTRVTAERVLRGRDLYNTLPRAKGQKAVFYALINIVLLFIRIDFSIPLFFEWLKRVTLTRRYILKNMTFEEADKLCENCVLVPLLGKEAIKKKEERESLVAVGAKVINAMTEDQLKSLLSKLES